MEKYVCSFDFRGQDWRDEADGQANKAKGCEHDTGFAGSIHGQALAKAEKDVPTCATCHMGATRGQVLFDGVLYPSRNNYPAKSIALFERASAKVSVIEDIDLVDHVDWPRFVATYRIGVEPDPGPLEPDDEAS